MTAACSDAGDHPLLDSVTALALWLISSLFLASFLPCGCAAVDCIPTCAAVDCIPEGYRQN